MKPSPQLNIQQLCQLVNGQLLMPQLPPLGRDWEPILGVAVCLPQTTPTVDQEEDVTGGAVWLTSDDHQEAWWQAQAAFSRGALAVISPFALPPQDGRVTIQSEHWDTCRGLMNWCHTESNGVLGIVIVGPDNEHRNDANMILAGDDPVQCAQHWLRLERSTDLVIELDLEKKEQVLYQSVLPQCDFLGIYSLAVGAQQVQQLLNEIVLFASVGNVGWLSQSAPILLAPECWVGPMANHEEWSRVRIQSPGENYVRWIDDLKSKENIAGISSSD
jgi:hypothetical protein